MDVRGIKMTIEPCLVNKVLNEPNILIINEAILSTSYKLYIVFNYIYKYLSND